MKKDFLHFIYTPATGLGLHLGFRGQDWYEYRINKIFKKYTLPSLLNQTCRNFIHWLSFRPAEKDNPVTIELAEYLEKLAYPFIFTFDGLMWHDDKFPIKTFKHFLSCARDFLDWKALRPNFIKDYLIDLKKNETLPDRLQKSLNRIKDILLLPRKDWIYQTVLATDDMYSSDAIKIIQEQEPVYRKALLYSKGYIYNAQTGQLADHNPTTCQPFYTLIFPWDVFWNAKAHLKYMGDFKSHEDIPRIFGTQTLPLRKYMVLCHKQNISTRWYQTRFRSALLKFYQRDNFVGKEYKGKIKQKILADFGIKKNIFLTRLDSDDMLYKTTIESIQKASLPKKGVLSLPDYIYGFVMHKPQKQISTTWEGEARGKEYKGRQKRKLLKGFGIGVANEKCKEKES